MDTARRNGVADLMTSEHVVADRSRRLPGKRRSGLEARDRGGYGGNAADGHSATMRKTVHIGTAAALQAA